MTGFRVALTVFLVCLLPYTLVTGLTQGWNLVPVFLGDLFAVTWRGQFNLDFLTFLLLAAFWVSWHDGFSLRAMGLSVLTVCLGMSFLAAYLLYLSVRTGGDSHVLLLGVRAKE